MLVTTIIGVLCVCFAWLEKKKIINNGLKVSFIIIFIFLAIRFEFGNDYKSYYLRFIEINIYNNILDTFSGGGSEIGWVILCRIFRQAGFYWMTAMLALFNCLIYYKFIKKYVPRNYYWLSIFLYIFKPSFMLVHLSAMRQSIAIAIFVVSIEYIIKKKIGIYIVLIITASLFHGSAIVLLPAYIIGVIDWKKRKPALLMFILIYMCLFIYGKNISVLLNNVVSKYFIQYEVYRDTGVVNYGMGMIFLSIMFVMTIYFTKYQEKKYLNVFIISIISYLFVPLGLMIQMIPRIGMYFSPGILVTYPLIFNHRKCVGVKKLIILAIIIMTVYEYVIFFASDINREYYSIYKTII